MRVTVPGLQCVAKTFGNRRARHKVAQTIIDEGLKAVQLDQVIQHWHGYVISVSAETFWAALGVVIGEGPDIYAEIYRRELTEADQPELVTGRYVEWKIGYRWDAKGTCRKFSEIRLIQVAPFTDNEKAEAEQWAAGWVDLFAEDVEPVTVQGAQQ